MADRIFSSESERPHFGWAAFWEQVRARWYFYPVALFVGARVALLAWASWVAQQFPVSVQDKLSLYYGTTPFTSGLDGLIWGPWQRWDTMWYVKIAQHGYSSTDLSAAFFPLYPSLIRLSAPLLGANTTAAAVIISSVAALAAFIILFRYTSEIAGDQVARSALLLLAAFPTAFFLFAGYTESLFVALALGSLLLARRGHWGWAGLLGALVALTRPQGSLFLLVLAVEFFLQYRARQVRLWQAGFLVLPALGGISFPLYLMWQFNDLTLWFRVQNWWHRSALPWDGILQAFDIARHTTNAGDFVYAIRDPLAAILFLALLGWGLYKLRPTLSVYTAIIILPPLFSISVFQPLLPLASMWRYVIVAFPGFVLLAQLPFVARHPKSVALVLFAIQLIVLAQYVEWVFVG